MKYGRICPLVPHAMVAIWVLVILPVASTSFGAGSFVDVTYSWTAPASGSPVVHYVVQHSFNEGPFMVIAEAPENKYSLSAELGGNHQIRVAGVDAQGRQGPWSLASEKYGPEVLADYFPEYVNGFKGLLSITDGDPGDPEIIGEAILQQIQVIERFPGGNLRGEVHLFAAILSWNPTGLGIWDHFQRQINIPVSGEIHTGPRSNDDLVQHFATDIFRLHGRLEGDPDFCELNITAGTDFHMPSPGSTTISNLVGDRFATQSSFELNFRLEYTGCSGSSLEGLRGFTEGREYFRNRYFIEISDLDETEVPGPVVLFQNTPNPFNPVTVIGYELPHGGSHVVLDILDVRGHKVCTLVDEQQTGGQESVVWDGRDASGRQVTAGIYFYRLTTNHGTVVRKMAMVK